MPDQGNRCPSHPGRSLLANVRPKQPGGGVLQLLPECTALPADREAWRVRRQLQGCGREAQRRRPAAHGIDQAAHLGPRRGPSHSNQRVRAGTRPLPKKREHPELHCIAAQSRAGLRVVQSGSGGRPGRTTLPLTGNARPFTPVPPHRGARPSPASCAHPPMSWCDS